MPELRGLVQSPAQHNAGGGAACADAVSVWPCGLHADSIWCQQEEVQGSSMPGTAVLSGVQKAVTTEAARWQGLCIMGGCACLPGAQQCSCTTRIVRQARWEPPAQAADT